MEYREQPSDDGTPMTSDTIRVQHPTINTNFSSFNIQYTLVVDELQPGTTYMFQVVASNSIGETLSQDMSFETRASGKNNDYPPTHTYIHNDMCPNFSCLFSS